MSFLDWTDKNYRLHLGFSISDTKRCCVVLGKKRDVLSSIFLPSSFPFLGLLNFLKRGLLFPLTKNSTPSFSNNNILLQDPGTFNIRPRPACTLPPIVLRDLDSSV